MTRVIFNAVRGRINLLMNQLSAVSDLRRLVTSAPTATHRINAGTVNTL
jgi:hypothetical protein